MHDLVCEWIILCVYYSHILVCILFTLIGMETKVDELKAKKRPFKRGGNVCAATKCHNRRYNSDVSLFRFPKEHGR